MSPPPLAVDLVACDSCGAPATCSGRYDNMTEDAPACDTCCGHGCEDGHCEPLEQAEGVRLIGVGLPAGAAS